ncbi:MAG: phosphoribosylanthranilate isomerase [Alphaproteobacteria bacterium]
MTIGVKICGINDPAALAAAVNGGARFVGFVFYPPSPRAIDAAMVMPWIRTLSESVTPVGLLVNPTDQDIGRAVASGVKMLQLHGDETPARLHAIREKTGLPIMKAIKVATAEDLALTSSFESVADWLLFDAKPPADRPESLPGGNARAFDWNLMTKTSIQRPWMLAGGLHSGNLVAAIRQSHTACIDVSSGVEDRPGVKNPAKIAELLAVARAAGL